MRIADLAAMPLLHPPRLRYIKPEATGGLLGKLFSAAAWLQTAHQLYSAQRPLSEGRFLKC